MEVKHWRPIGLIEVKVKEPQVIEISTALYDSICHKLILWFSDAKFKQLLLNKDQQNCNKCLTAILCRTGNSSQLYCNATSHAAKNTKKTGVFVMGHSVPSKIYCFFFSRMSTAYPPLKNTVLKVRRCLAKYLIFNFMLYISAKALHVVNLKGI